MNICPSPSMAGRRNKPVDEAALDFIDKHRNAFGLKSPKNELKLLRKSEQQWGSVDVSFQQNINGVPIWGSSVGVHLNKDKDIYVIASPNTVPTPDINTTPLVTEDEAINVVRADKAKNGYNNYSILEHPVAELVIYKRENSSKLSLAYLVDCLYMSHNWIYVIDAKDSSIIDKRNITIDD